jgi:hypothetical protein
VPVRLDTEGATLLPTTWSQVRASARAYADLLPTG